MPAWKPCAQAQFLRGVNIGPAAPADENVTRRFCHHGFRDATGSQLLCSPDKDMRDSRRR